MNTDIRVEKLRAWSYHRQGLVREAVSPLQSLMGIVAVYSSQPTAPLSLLARTGNLDPDGFRQLEIEGQAVRLPAMRGSIFLLPVSTAARILSATRIPLKKLQGRLEYGGLTWDDYERVRAAFLKQATTPKAADELQQLIPLDGKLMVAIRVLAYEGLALRLGESLRRDSFRYVAMPAWLGEPLDEVDPDESLQSLAGDYLRAFGPVTASDFAWWAGVTKTLARSAFSGSETVDVGGGLLLHKDDLPAFERCDPLSGNEIALLPKWDAYTMGYPAESRARFIDEAHLDKAYPKIRATRGDAAPLVLRGGQAVAIWAHQFSADRMTVTVTPFDLREDLDWLSVADFEPVARLLGASDLALTFSRE